MKNASRRWLLYALAGLATAGSMIWVDHPDEAVPSVASVAAPSRAVASTMPKGRPTSVTGWSLPERRFSMPAVDPFDLAEPDQPPPPGRPEAPVAVAAAAPPPLPYTYVGQWIENGVTVAFLRTAQGLNVAARAGSRLDGDYQVDTIDERGIGFKYLPLGVKQNLSFTQTTMTAADARVQPKVTAATNDTEETN